MRGISQSQFKTIQTNSQLYENYEADQSNPEYQFSFKDYLLKQNANGVKQWKERAKSTKNCIIGSRAQIDSVYKDNDRLEEIVRTQRREIQKLKRASVHRSNLNVNFSNDKDKMDIKNIHIDTKGQYYSRSKHHQAYSYQSPIIKPFSNNVSTTNHRSDSPGYSQIYSKRTYKGDSAQSLRHDQQQLYRLKINHLHEMIDYLKRQKQLMENQFTVRQMEFNEELKCMELQLRQWEQDKSRQIDQIVSNITRDYKHQIRVIVSKDESKKRKLLALKLNIQNVINIALKPIVNVVSPDFLNMKKQLQQEKMEIMKLKDQLKEQSLEINDQTKKMMSRFDESEAVYTPRQLLNQSDNNIVKSRETQYKFHEQSHNKQRILELQTALMDMQSKYKLEIFLVKRINQQLMSKCSNYELEIVLLQQKLSIKRCFEQFQCKTEQVDDRIQDHLLFSKSNNLDINEQSKYSSQESTHMQLKQLKQLIQEKDQNIAMLVKKYEKIQSKLLEVISFNQKINKLIIDQQIES